MLIETFDLIDFNFFKEQLLIWTSQFSSCSFLDNNQYTSAWQMQECVVAAGARYELCADGCNALTQLQAFLDAHAGEWIFGHLSYDLKTEIDVEVAETTNESGFSTISFYVPQTIFQLSVSSVTIYAHEASPASIWQQVNAIAVTNTTSEPSNVVVQPRISRKEYIQTVEKLKEHIHRGDCYEVNFCQEFFAENIAIDPVAIFRELSQFSPNPFSCFYRSGHAYLLCASPERYLARRGKRLFSQPIKGTAPRNLTDAADDAARITSLQTDNKERSENVMVVDLVRNDLSRICKEGSVEVDELFKIYTYPQVHQMISTISGEVSDNLNFTEILRATFPMGSMTGAPKKRVLELIASYESGSRGLFSGAVGYISPGGDFDFNVVIRSLLYNQNSKYLSYWVGGGITWYSNAAAEYEECMLKAMAIKKVLQAATP